MQHLTTPLCTAISQCVFWTALQGLTSCYLCGLVFYLHNTLIYNPYFLLWLFVNSDDKGIPDESDCFMMDPVGFTSEYAKNWSLPSHIVLFEPEEKLLRDFLVSHSFRLVCVGIFFPHKFYCNWF